MLFLNIALEIKKKIKIVSGYTFLCISISFLSQNNAFCSDGGPAGKEEKGSTLSLGSLIVGFDDSKEESVEVAFFNVGQGNCTVVKAPNKQDIFIVDAGTSKLPQNIVLGNTSEGLEDVVLTNSIKQWILNNGKESYNVRFLLSHPDKDHQSLIAGLCSSLQEEKCICSYLKHPVQDFNKQIESQLQKIFSTIKIEDLSNPIYNKNGFSLSLFNKKFPVQITGSNDKNANSLVIFLQFSKHGMFLTGDATEETLFFKEGEKRVERANWSEFESIRKSGRLQNIVFQPCHHGSYTDEANSQKLIDKIMPHITVFSSPRYSQYRHPSYQVVERIASNYQKRQIQTLISREKDPLYHFYFLDKTIDSSEIDNEENKFNHEGGGLFKPRILYRNFPLENTREDGLYSAHLTNYPIFHTGSHGTLIFTLTADNAFVDTFDYTAVYAPLSSASSSSSRKTPKKGKIILLQHAQLQKTTGSVFQKLGIHDALSSIDDNSRALSLGKAVWPIRPQLKLVATLPPSSRCSSSSSTATSPPHTSSALYDSCGEEKNEQN